uniref:Uncharacterized protein n=1 Tax=Tanacetum cinerariifolium TaxID=118510 RepID=A0A699I0Z2_TANCI|nr:hypothetical protein [Tanacetum cinerariifolium]
MYKAKVKYDKYYDKMLNMKALGKITNYDVLSRGKGLITLKVYREDGSDEIIQNFKSSDLHLGEWREVTNVCPNRTISRWSTKRYKSSVKYEDHHAGTIFNELSLDFTKGMAEMILLGLSVPS